MTAACVRYAEDLVTPQMRSRAKAVNFGIVYGIGAFSLSKDIGVSRREAEDYIHDYLRNYKGVADYMERVVEEAKKKTAMWRRCSAADAICRSLQAPISTCVRSVNVWRATCRFRARLRISSRLRWCTCVTV